MKTTKEQAIKALAQCEFEHAHWPTPDSAEALRKARMTVQEMPQKEATIYSAIVVVTQGPNRGHVYSAGFSVSKSAASRMGNRAVRSGDGKAASIAEIASFSNWREIAPYVEGKKATGEYLLTR